MSSSDASAPGLVSGHAKLAQGAVESAIGSVTGNASWQQAGEQAKQQGISELKDYQSGHPPTGTGSKLEAAVGSAVGCEGLEKDAQGASGSSIGSTIQDDGQVKGAQGKIGGTDQPGLPTGGATSARYRVFKQTLLCRLSDKNSTTRRTPTLPKGNYASTTHRRMSYTPTASGPGSGTSTPVNASLKNAPKPSLAGAKQKQRKGVAKAQAKFEPTVFRDEFLRSLATASSPNDYEGYLRILESLANELDFRKYENQLFELLIVGRLLAPGGTLLVDNAPACPFSVLGRETSEQKDVVGVFGKLIRRYKYLQKPLEQSSLPTILQNANKLDKRETAAPAAGLTVPTAAADGGNTPGSLSGTSTPVSGNASALAGPPVFPRPNLDKLATFTALVISSGLLAPTVLSSIKRDHLIKDGTALAFITTYLKTYLANEPIEHLASTLKKSNCYDLLEFFPLQRRSLAELNRHFKDKTVGLDKVAEWYNKIAENLKKEEILLKLRELCSEDGSDGEGRASNEEVIAYLESVQKSSATPIVDTEFISLIWSGLMTGLDLNSAKDQQLNEITLKYIKSVTPVLEKFSTGPRTEIALINSIQLYIYNHITLLNLFPRIVQLLYNDDILSSQAIFYWNEKGAKPSGKQSFIKVMEPLVKAIKESEESDEDDDDE